MDIWERQRDLLVLKRQVVERDLAQLDVMMAHPGVQADPVTMKRATILKRHMEGLCSHYNSMIHEASLKIGVADDIRAI